MDKFSKEDVVNLVAASNVNEAISVCYKQMKFLIKSNNNLTKAFQDSLTTLTILLSRMNELKKNKMIGILSYEEEQKEKNKIIANFMSWIDDVDSEFWLEIPKENLRTKQIKSSLDVVDYSGFDNSKELNVFRLRAECEVDIVKFQKIIGDAILPIAKARPASYLPDTEIEFKTYLSLEEVKKVIRKVEDGHVMLQTVAYKDDYTGKRNFKLFPFG